MRTRNFRNARPVQHANLSDFESKESFEDGNHVIWNGDIPIDFSIDSQEHATTTIVCFHGAVQKTVQLPWTVGAGVVGPTGANRISFSDPSLLLADDLILGWFLGSRKLPKYQEILVSVVQSIIQRSGTSHTIFFGGSAGGFAALNLSAKFPGSLSIAMNPQTSLDKYYQRLVSEYLKAAWPSLNTIAQLPKNIQHNLIRTYSSETANTIAYVQNTRDEFHVQNHQLPFLEGSSSELDLWTLEDSWGDPSGKGHVPPPKELIGTILKEATSSSGQWANSLSQLGFTEFNS